MDCQAQTAHGTFTLHHVGTFFLVQSLTSELWHTLISTTIQKVLYPTEKKIDCSFQGNTSFIHGKVSSNLNSKITAANQMRTLVLLTACI